MTKTQGYAALNAQTPLAPLAPFAFERRDLLPWLKLIKPTTAW